MSRLLEEYKNEIVPKLKKEFGYENVQQIPKITKIIVNVGAGEAVQNHKTLEFIVKDIKNIAGQQPVITKAKKSIAGFKLREGVPIGVKVTLRRQRMYEFLDRLVTVALPRVRDFKGVSRRSFDGRGNYTLGISEQIIFPEVDFDKTDKIRGLNITVVTTANTDEEARALLTALGMPFRKN
ncbi:MAG: large subunit ribosomal protein L5 [bacterium]